VSARWRASELGLPEPSEAELLSDALLNARLGADNLAWLLATYDGDAERALCAYNAGARRLKEITSAAGGWERWRDERQRTGTSAILSYARKVLHLRDELYERGYFGEFYAQPPDGPRAAPASPEEAPAPLPSSQ
jgi:soluble lytic murein transglycosylase-like protein